MKIKNYLILLILFSVLFLIGFISLPALETWIPEANYDLYLKDSEYWSKEYELELTIAPEDLPQKEKEIRQTKDILFKRLNKYGVERVTITEVENSTDTKATLLVHITSSKSNENVERLLSQRFFIRFVTRKDDVDFDSEENQFNYLFEDNYDKTDLTREDFRNVYVTLLQNTLGEENYFAIFKTWPLLDSEYRSFADAHAGETIGLSIDGIVTPVTVPVDTPTSSTTGSTVEVPGLLAVGINGGADQAELLKILYNSGVIPVEYSVVSDSNVEVGLPSLQYIQVALSVLASLWAFAIYIYFRKEQVELLSFVSESLLTLGMWLAVLKIFTLPIDSTVLLVSAILGILFVKTVNLRSSYRSYTYITLLGLLIVSYMFGIGYIRDLSVNMSLIVLASFVAQGFTKLFFDNLKEVMER